MKKIMKLFVYVAAAAMTLASCQKTEVDNNLPKGYEYTFLLGSADTKAVVGDNCVEWEAGDRVGSFTKVNNGYSEVSVNDGQATISVYSPEGLAVNDKLYFYYPKASGSTVQKTSVPMSILTEQDGKDEMPMVSLPFVVKTESDKSQTPYVGEIKFANLGAVIEFNVYSTNTDYLSEKVQSVTYDAGAALAGNFEFDLTSVNYANQNTLKISGYEATSVVSTLAEPVVVGSSKEDAAKVKMVVAPGSYAGTISVKTDKATYTYNIATPKEYTRSSLRPLGADLAKGTRTAATTEEYTIQWDSASDWTDMTLSSGYYTVKAVKNNGSTAPTINSTKNDCRVYAKGSVIVTHSAANIKKLVFNISAKGKEQLADITASVGDVTIDTNNWKVIWEGDASSVTFTVGDKSEYGTEGKDKSGQLCFTSINAVAETTDAPIVPVLKEIKLSGMTTEYELNAEFSFDGTVTASYTVGDDKAVEPTKVSSPDMTTAGTKEVTVKYTEAGVTCEAKYSINVTDPNAEEISLSMVTSVDQFTAGYYVILSYDKKYYVPNAQSTSAAAVQQYAVGNVSEDMVWKASASEGGLVFESVKQNDVYLWGAPANNGVRMVKTSSTNGASKVWKVDLNSTYGVIAYAGVNDSNEKYYLAAYGSQDWRNYRTGNSLTNPANFYKVEGWSNGETPDPEPETPAPVINISTASPIEVAANGGNAEFAYTVTNPTDGVSVSATVPTTVDWISNIQTTTEKVTFAVAENTATEAREAVITLAYEGAAPKTITVKQAAAELGGGDEPDQPSNVTESLNIYANKGTLNNKTISWTGENFVCSNSQASSTNAIRTTDTTHYRVYAKSVLNFTAKNDKKFKTIVVNCESGYADDLANSTYPSGVTASYSGNVVTITAANPVSEISITIKTQTRINKVTATLN